MAKRDKKAPDKNFNNPFAALKGLSASVPAAKPSAPADKPAKAPVVDKEPASVEPELSFADAMRQLGVRQQEGAGDALPRPRRSLTVDAPEEPSVSGAAINTATAADRERLRRLKRSQPHPEAELDLHGMTAAQALAKVTWFLDNAIFHGCQVVRIITGRGKSSEAGPVLRPQVEAYLDGPGRRQVLEWSLAPATQGGEGALLVFLKLPE
jgi:DNA-nicking Smr family endonuclease